MARLLLFALLAARHASAFSLPNLSEKVILITGSTDGIGKHTATRIAQTGATILLHGRNQQKIDIAKSNILKIQPDAKIKTYCYDLSCIHNVKAFANELINDNKRLDILVNNSGVFSTDYKLTNDGLETTFAVNVMAPFLLSILLLPLLIKTPKSRILNVSSTSQFEGNPRIILNNLQFQHGGFSDHASYSLSKLCMAAMSHEFALQMKMKPKKHENTQENNIITGIHDQVTETPLVYSCDPGDIDTVMLRTGWAGYPGRKIEDANDEFHLITCEYDRNMHGKYYVNRRESQCNPQVYQDSLRQGLWKELERITNVTISI